MDRTEFLKELEEIVLDKLYIGNKQADQNLEIKNNTWSISVSNALLSTLTKNDFDVFFKKVVSNRSLQVKELKPEGKILFYLWFDEMSAQLKFCIASDFGLELPFGCRIELINSYEVIINDFLAFRYHDGIPLDELEEVNHLLDEIGTDKGDTESAAELKVYCVHL